MVLRFLPVPACCQVSSMFGWSRPQAKIFIPTPSLIHLTKIQIKSRNIIHGRFDTSHLVFAV